MQSRFEIDRAAGTITTTSKSFFYRKKRSYPVADILAVKLERKGVAVEEGYGTLCYSVLLEGRNGSLELLCTEDEREGESCFREMKEFLEQYKRTQTAVGAEKRSAGKEK